MIEFKKPLLVCFLFMTFFASFGQSYDNVNNEKNIDDSLFERYSINGRLDFELLNADLGHIYQLLDSGDEKIRWIGKKLLSLRFSVNPNNKNRKEIYYASEYQNNRYNDFNTDIIRNTPLVPKELSTDDLLTGDPVRNNLKTGSELITSADPKVRELAKQQMYREAAQDPAITKGLGLNNMVRYQEGQDKFTGGKFGFDPYKTVQQNRDYYARMGYTYSYKYSDREVLTYTGLAAGILILIFYILSKQKNFQNVTNNPK